MPRKLARVALVLLAAATGCASLIGFPDYSGTGGGAGGSGHGATSTAGTGTGGKGTGGKGTGGKGTGAGGKGGMGTGGMGTGGASSTGTCGASVCVEGAPCYEGLDGTEGVGACAGGTLTCEGGVPVCSDTRPDVERCNGGDQNCDGLTACTGQPRWAKSLLNTTSGMASNAVAAGLDGTVALAGVSTLDPGFFVQTFDAHGRPCWTDPIVFNGGANGLAPSAVALSGAKQTPDGRVAQVICGPGLCGTPLSASTFVVGTGTGPVTFPNGTQAGAGGNTDAFIAKLDPTGQVVWGQLFGSDSDDTAAAVAVDTQGNVYVTGALGDAMLVPPCTGGADAGALTAAGWYVAQVHPDGSCGWLKGFAGPVKGTGIAVDDAGIVTVTGSFSQFATVSFDGQMLTSAPGETGAIVQLQPDGSLAGPPIGMGCKLGNPVYAATTPDGHAFAMCLSIAAVTGCPSSNGQDQTVISDLSAQKFSCYLGASGASAVTPAGLAADRAGNVVALVTGAGPLGSPDWGSTTVNGNGLFAFKLSSPYNMIPEWGFAYDLGSGAEGYGLAVDGMGDVVVGVTPNDNLSIGLLTLTGGVAGVAELAP